MNVLAQLVKELEYEELILMKKDLEKGTLNKLVKKQIVEKRDEQQKTCPVCESSIRRGEGIYIEFGSPSMRQQATFDGVDCLRYFIEKHLSK